MTPTQQRVLGAHLRQPDQRTCGPSCLVVARMLNDAAFADQVLTAGSFHAQVRGLHRRANAVFDRRPQLPWPRALGLAPWAGARLMSRVTGRPGRRYRSRLIVRRPASAYVAISHAVRDGHVVPVYVGSRWLPRHVVLAVQHDAGGLQIYDPAVGRVVPLARAEFATASLAVSGWSKAWFAVLPTHP